MERMAMVVIACNVLLHAGLGLDRLHRLSLYVDRPLVQAAIDDRNDRYLGERRGLGQEIQATDDLRLVRSEWRPWGGLSRFDVTIRNESSTSAWLDIHLAIAYADAAGTPIETREIVVKQIVQPGSERSWADLADRSVPDRAAAATVRITLAERAEPARGR